MKPPSKLRGNAGADPELLDAMAAQNEEAKVQLPEADSDSEYENVPKKVKSAPAVNSVHEPAQQSQPTQPDAMDVDNLIASAEADANKSQHPSEDEPLPATSTAPISDDDWLRSRTSRLLGLNGEDEDDMGPAVPALPSPRHDQLRADDSDFEGFDDDVTTTKQPQLQPDQPEVQDQEQLPAVDETDEKVRASQRLYLRNLSYKVTEDALRSAFDGFGNLGEVSGSFCFCFCAQQAPIPTPTMFQDEHLIGTSDAKAYDVIRIEYFSRCISSLNETIHRYPSNFCIMG